MFKQHYANFEVNVMGWNEKAKNHSVIGIKHIDIHRNVRNFPHNFDCKIFRRVLFSRGISAISNSVLCIFQWCECYVSSAILTIAGTRRVTVRSRICVILQSDSKQTFFRLSFICTGIADCLSWNRRHVHSRRKIRLFEVVHPCNWISIDKIFPY